MASSFPARRVFSNYTDASVTNIPTAYSSAAASLILTGLSTNNLPYQRLQISNQTGTRIVLCLTDKDAPVPSSSDTTNTSQIYVEAGAIDDKDSITIFDRVYLRSQSGIAITTGLVIITLW